MFLRRLWLGEHGLEGILATAVAFISKCLTLTSYLLQCIL